MSRGTDAQAAAGCILLAFGALAAGLCFLAGYMAGVLTR